MRSLRLCNAFLGTRQQPPFLRTTAIVSRDFRCDKLTSRPGTAPGSHGGQTGHDGRTGNPARLTFDRPAQQTKGQQADQCQRLAGLCVSRHFVASCVWAISRTSVQCSLSSTVYHNLRFGPPLLQASDTPVRKPSVQFLGFSRFISLYFHVPSMRRLR